MPRQRGRSYQVGQATVSAPVPVRHKPKKVILMGKQYIYTIANLTRKHGPRTVLENIWLAFYPGAKIGVLGRNGSGKSTLLRIMAGLDTEFEGEAQLTDGFTCGYLPQEPALDETLSVFENVKLGVAPTQALLDEFNEITGRMGEPMSDEEMAKLYDRMGVLQDGQWDPGLTTERSSGSR